jgi:hypothetical protein
MTMPVFLPVHPSMVNVLFQDMMMRFDGGNNDSRRAISNDSCGMEIPSIDEATVRWKRHFK